MKSLEVIERKLMLSIGSIICMWLLAITLFVLSDY